MQPLLAPGMLAAVGARCRAPLASITISSLKNFASIPSAQPPEQDIAAELLALVQDRGLLRTAGFIGGKWSQASNGATYEV